MTRLGRTAAVVVSLLGVAGGLTACGKDADVLTVYSAQHESLVRAMLADGSILADVAQIDRAPQDSGA